MATNGPMPQIIKHNNQWSEFSKDIVVVVKRMETFEQKRIKLNTMNTIGDLMNKIRDVYGENIEDQNLVHGTEVLANNCNTLDMHDITDASTIYLTTRRSTSSCRNNRLIITSMSSCFMVMWRSGDTVDFVRDKIATKTTLHKDKIAIFPKFELWTRPALLRATISSTTLE